MALGQQRLAILDLSPLGHQPMISGNGRYAIVFNGEIYNFRQLREQLVQSGVALKSHSDTEVILELYAIEGASCVTKSMACSPWLSGIRKHILCFVLETHLASNRSTIGKPASN